MYDVFSKAILDYYSSEEEIYLTLHNSYGDSEALPVEVFFRDEEDLTALEEKALSACRGNILDVGAGPGALSFILQRRGHMVTPLELSPGCIEVMNKLNLLNIVQEDFWKHEERYDTVLILMNGLGLAGNLKNVQPFLAKFKRLLSSNGQLLIDSSDIGYLYETGIERPKDHYYGEIKYRYEYQGEMGAWFEWLYLDQATLITLANELELHVQILAEDENDQYLARITPY